MFLDLDTREKHILQTGYPEDGTYHICLIGRTHMIRKDLDDIGDDIMKDFGGYSLFWNNCQKFLRKLYYSWFQKNMGTSYLNKKKLMKQPPDASSRIANMKVDELRLVSQQVDGANVALSTQQLMTIHDGITQNIMNDMQLQSTLTMTVVNGVGMS